MSIPLQAPQRGLQRIRHELKFRVLDVVAVERLTPRMLRVSLSGEELRGFASAAYDDHVKLFFPSAGKSFERPTPTPNGLAFPEGKRPQARDYTPRRHDLAANRLDIDFVLHGDGPASEWAAQARPGQQIGVGGPRGSFVVTGEFDWYLLIGDETALPAISRRLEELPAGARVLAVIEVADEAERQTLSSAAAFDLRWVDRQGAPPGSTDGLLEAVRRMALPAGDGYCFVAGEATASKAIRQHLVEERGLNPDWIKAAGYWQRNAADFDDGHAH